VADAAHSAAWSAHDNERPVALIGPMGSGKSTVGRRLAAALAWNFVDSDQEIERRTGVDIPFIFEKEGEAGFRRREREVIAELLDQQRLVLATGGGAVLDVGTRQRLKERALVVYLMASVEQQFRRTRKDAHRPLLNVPDPKGRLWQLHHCRDPVYREVANLCVDTERQLPASVAADILAMLAVSSA
jgi:shikimate kinase